MTINPNAVESLAAKLAADPTAAAPLTPQERELVVAALAQLGADQGVILRLRRLLDAHDESGERLDAILAEGVRVVRDAVGGAAPSEGYDFAAAAAARADLAEAVADARSGRQVIAAALAFARGMASLL